jgi:hypothetical protein
MDMESSEKEYRREVNVAIRQLEALLSSNYPARIYMLDPESCSDYELIQQLYGRPRLFCEIDDKHTADDAIPLERICWYPVEHLSAQEMDDNYLLVYEGANSMPPEVCLWPMLKQHRIIPTTAEKYSRMQLYTSPEAVKIIVSKIARKPENILIAENLIDSCLKQKTFCCRSF